MSQEKMETYRIQVRGILHERWRDWFTDLHITTTSQEDSFLTVTVPDQSALRGILDRLWDLNYEVIAVSPVAPQSELEADRATS